jgi:hypothetical protein
MSQASTRSEVDLFPNAHNGWLVSVLPCSLKGKLPGFYSLGRNATASPKVGQGRAHGRIPVGLRGEADKKVRRPIFSLVLIANILGFES